MGYDGSLKFDTKIDESGFNSGMKKVGSIATKGLATLGAAVAGAGAAFVAVNKSALDSVASLEQNIDGVETLFKNSAEVVIANANRAYKTAQLSANEYMSTVTSFSASLLQGLGGNTKKAAEIADVAIVDMADNANKMGTSMESIQNAYQGFAKQNYTMLDNLKLGYGGTQKEMVRLINDSGVLGKKIKSLDNITFDQMIMAIHKIQENLGIAGASAGEAFTTIEGSMNSAKAAWDNFLNGSSSVDEFVDAVTTATEVIFKNVGEITPRLISTLPAAAKGLSQGLTSAFKSQGIADIGIKLVQDIITGIDEQGPVLLDQASQITESLISVIESEAPKIITTGANLLASFLKGIGGKLPDLIPQALKMVVIIADSIIANIPTIVSSGISLLKGLVEGIINSLPLLITEGPRIVNDFADAVYAGLGKLLITGAQLLLELIKGIGSNIPLLLQNAGQILLMFINIFSLSKLLSLGKSLVTSMTNGVKGAASSVKGAGKDILKSLVNGIKSLATHPVATIKGIITKITGAFTSISWSTIGKNIISGIAKGLTASAGVIVTAAKNAAKSALDSAKNFLGIHSPSTVFRDEVGKNMALGMGVGFERNVPTEQMEGSISKSVNRMKKRTYDITANSPVTTTKINDEHEIVHPEDKGIDWDEWEKRQRKLNDERDGRPIFLGTDRIDKKLPKGAVPAW